ncbi:MAG: hypothetical protein ABI193_03725 [Minicystis sp.]
MSSLKTLSLALLFFSLSAAGAACGPPPTPETPETPAPGSSAAPTVNSVSPGVTGVPTVTAAPLATTPPTSSTAPTATPAPAAVNNVPLQPSKMLEDVKKIGLDLRKVGDLEKIEMSQKKKLMQLFQRSMGYSSCTGCHVEGDFAKDTRNLQITRQMWRHYVVALRDDKGGPLFCDSCHAGNAKLLDRGDKKALVTFMTENYEGKLSRADKKEHGCVTCHGDDMQMKIIEKSWKIPAK